MIWGQKLWYVHAHAHDMYSRFGSKVTVCKCMKPRPYLWLEKDESFSEHVGGSWWAGRHQGGLHRLGEVHPLYEIRWGRVTVADRVRWYKFNTSCRLSFLVVCHGCVFNLCSASDGLEVWVVEINERDVVSSYADHKIKPYGFARHAWGCSCSFIRLSMKIVYIIYLLISSSFSFFYRRNIPVVRMRRPFLLVSGG